LYGHSQLTTKSMHIFRIIFIQILIITQENLLSRQDSLIIKLISREMQMERSKLISYKLSKSMIYYPLIISLHSIQKISVSAISHCIILIFSFIPTIKTGLRHVSKKIILYFLPSDITTQILINNWIPLYKYTINVLRAKVAILCLFHNKPWGVFNIFL
jgi:hypothetical protein